MASAVSLSVREDYWVTFELTDEDRDFIYNHLLEIETPLTSPELLSALVNERIRREKLALEKQRTSGGDIYIPANIYQNNQDLVFPAFGWQHARVIGIRPGQNPDLGYFDVIQVRFDNNDIREFASNIPNHHLNQPQEISIEESSLDADAVLHCQVDNLPLLQLALRLAGRSASHALKQFCKSHSLQSWYNRAHQLIEVVGPRIQPNMAETVTKHLWPSLFVAPHGWPTFQNQLGASWLLILTCPVSKLTCAAPSHEPTRRSSMLALNILLADIGDVFLAIPGESFQPALQIFQVAGGRIYHGSS